MIDLSVLIATHNGARVLRRTLDGYCAVAEEDENWKLIIVNNASTDDTEQLLSSYMHRLPLTIVNVPEPGKNGALNAGLKAVDGEVIILSDDDSIPQPGFLDHWRQAFKAQPEIDLFGGSIDLVFDVAPPDWLLSQQLHFEELYALRRDIEAGPIHHLQIYGPNMAARKHVFESGLTFNPNIGPNGADANYAMGSESDFCSRAAEAGFTSGFAPAPVVHHIVRANQVKPEYFERRAFKLGRGVAQRYWESGILNPKRRLAFIAALADIYRKLKQAGLYVLTLQANPRRKFLSTWNYYFYCGFHQEHARQKATARSPAIAAVEPAGNKAP